MTTPPSCSASAQRQRRLAARGRPCDKHRLVGRLVRIASHDSCRDPDRDPPAALDDAALDARARALPQRRRAAHGSTPGIAADIPFTAGCRRSTNARSPSACARRWPARPIDVVVQPAADRRKKLFLADMDSTMIGQECIDELADFVGLKAQVAAITERAMRGEIAFEPALRERVALLKGLPVARDRRGASRSASR